MQLRQPEQPRERRHQRPSAPTILECDGVAPPGQSRLFSTLRRATPAHTHRTPRHAEIPCRSEISAVITMPSRRAHACCHTLVDAAYQSSTSARAVRPGGHATSTGATSPYSPTAATRYGCRTQPATADVLRHRTCASQAPVARVRIPPTQCNRCCTGTTTSAPRNQPYCSSTVLSHRS